MFAVVMAGGFGLERLGGCSHRARGHASTRYDLVYGGVGDLLAGRSLSFGHAVVRGQSSPPS
jgi:hypothetical protein